MKRTFVLSFSYWMHYCFDLHWQKKTFSMENVANLSRSYRNIYNFIQFPRTCLLPSNNWQICCTTETVQATLWMQRIFVFAQKKQIFFTSHLTEAEEHVKCAAHHTRIWTKALDHLHNWPCPKLCEWRKDAADFLDRFVQKWIWPSAHARKYAKHLSVAPEQPWTAQCSVSAEATGTIA